jgi:hypothetical protein
MSHRVSRPVYQFSADIHTKMKAPLTVKLQYFPLLLTFEADCCYEVDAYSLWTVCSLTLSCVNMWRAFPRQGKSVSSWYYPPPPLTYIIEHHPIKSFIPFALKLFKLNNLSYMLTALTE